MTIQDDLKIAIEAYLAGGDKLLLENIIKRNPEIITTKSGEIPDFHRIMDIKIKGKFYRLCREISNNESLLLKLTNVPSDVDGVPFWLQGEKLKSWANEELENPSDGPIEWDKYR